jgi:ketosteroid isomerase-like protein
MKRSTSLRFPGLISSAVATAILTGSITSAADSEVQKIHETYQAWVEAANARDIERWSTFLAEDPFFDPADSPPLTSTKAVIDFYNRSFADPFFFLDCEQEHVEISDSGEMAWARGVCHATFTDPEGERGTGTSRWFKVWEKQSDGSWKGRVNSWKYVDQP